MRNLKKILFVFALSLITLGVQAQDDPDPHSEVTANTETVTYQDYLKMQEAYKKGEISKEKLLNVFNQLTDEWDEICHPQKEKKTVGAVITKKKANDQKIMVLISAHKELKNPQVAKN